MGCRDRLDCITDTILFDGRTGGTSAWGLAFVGVRAAPPRERGGERGGGGPPRSPTPYQLLPPSVHSAVGQVLALQLGMAAAARWAARGARAGGAPGGGGGGLADQLLRVSINSDA